MSFTRPWLHRLTRPATPRSGKKFGLLLTALLLGTLTLATAHATTAAKGKQAKTEAKTEAIYRYEDGRAARWNSCKPIRWAYESKHETRPTLRLLKQALTKIGEASGLTYEPAGEGQVPDLLIRWEAHPSPAYREAKVQPLPGYTLEGIGLITVQSRYFPDKTYGDPEIVRGEVLLNPKAKLTKAFLHRALLKELAHTVGLAYSPDPLSALYPFVHEPGFEGLTRKDRAGLLRLGGGKPCHEFPIR